MKENGGIKFDRELYEHNQIPDLKLSETVNDTSKVLLFTKIVYCLPSIPRHLE